MENQQSGIITEGVTRLCPGLTGPIGLFKTEASVPLSTKNLATSWVASYSCSDKGLLEAQEGRTWPLHFDSVVSLCQSRGPLLCWVWDGLDVLSSRVPFP